MDYSVTGKVHSHDLEEVLGSLGGFVGRMRKMPVRPRMYIARGLGEVASNLSAPVAVVVIDKAFHQPYEDLKNRIAKAWILPNLDVWDEKLSHLKSIDPPFEREERHVLSRPEQARKIADLLVDQFGVKFGASLVGQFLTQDYFISQLHAKVSKRQNAIAVGVDRVVQLGSVLAFNTTLSEQAVGVQNTLIKVFKKAGMEEEKAEDWANYAVNFALPNAIAYVVSAELLTRFNAGKRL